MDTDEPRPHLPPDGDIDARLRAAFEPPQREVFEATAQRVVAAHRPAPIWPWLLAAAAMAIVALLFATRAERRGPEGHTAVELGAMWAAAYEDAVARGFSNECCCSNPFDLQHACQKRFASPLELHDSAELALLGNYAGLPTGGSMALLTRCGGSPVCVYVMPARHDPGVELPNGTGLHLDRRDLGDLVLYALSSNAANRALEAFVRP